MNFGRFSGSLCRCAGPLLCLGVELAATIAIVAVAVIVVVVVHADVCRLSLWLVVSLLCLCDGLYDHTVLAAQDTCFIVPTLTPFHR